MQMRVPAHTTTVSFEGVQYEVRDGIVELRDDLPFERVKDLSESFGMKKVELPEPGSNAAPKGEE